MKMRNKNLAALTPPMGWNSYDYYDTSVTEDRILANAEFMAAHLKEYGWEYIVVDIQWYAHNPGSRRDTWQYIPFGSVEMDEFGRLMPDPVRFPSSKNGLGFGPLADAIHKMGLKFGIHIMRGIPREACTRHLPVLGADCLASDIADAASVCPWNPDMYGLRDLPASQAYYDSLIGLYAGWGVDFIKCDDICNTNPKEPGSFKALHEIRMLHQAIACQERPIVLSLSPGPALIDKAWYYERYANMWRITDDFWDRWELLKDMFTRCQLWQEHVRPGCYPDCDMLPLGRIGKGFLRERHTSFTIEEQKTMMTQWCLFHSPLMLGAELTMLDQDTLSLLTNPHILGLMDTKLRARQVSLDSEHCIWVSGSEETGTNQFYAALYNFQDEESTVSADWDLLISPLASLWGRSHEEIVSITELWEQAGYPAKQIRSNGRLSANVAPHGVKLFALTLQQQEVT